MSASHVLLSRLCRLQVRFTLRWVLLLLVCFALRTNLSRADEAIEKIIEQVTPSVCTVKTNGGIGSGFVIFDNAVVTNHHVVSDAKSAEIIFHDGTKVSSNKTLFLDRVRDIAILEVKGIPATAIAVAFFGEVPKQGATVIAIGHPQGANYSVTKGIVSAVRSAEDLMRQFPGEQFAGTWIQTDAAINPGNSGGPLVGLNGQVVGMNSGGHVGTQNLNYAISSMDIHSVIEVAKRAQPKPLEGKGLNPQPAVAGNPAGAACAEPNREGKSYEEQIALLKEYKKCLEKQTPELEQRLKDFQADKNNKILNHPLYYVYKQAEAEVNGLNQKYQAITVELENTVKQHQLDAQFALNEIATWEAKLNRARNNPDLTGVVDQIRMENRILTLQYQVETLRHKRRNFSQLKRAELQRIEAEIYTWSGKARPFYDYKKQLDQREDELREDVKHHKRRISKCDNRLNGIQSRIIRKNPQHQEERAKKRLKMLERTIGQNGLKDKKDPLKTLIKYFPGTQAAAIAEELLVFNKPRDWHNIGKTKKFRATYQEQKGKFLVLLRNGEKKEYPKEIFSEDDLRLIELYTGK